MTEMDYKHHLISFEEDENGEPSYIAVNVDLVDDLNEDAEELENFDIDPIESFLFEKLEPAKRFVDEIVAGNIRSYGEACWAQAQLDI